MSDQGVEIEQLDVNTFRDIPMKDEKKSELVKEIEDDIRTVKWITIAIACLLALKIVQHLGWW